MIKSYNVRVRCSTRETREGLTGARIGRDGGRIWFREYQILFGEQLVSSFVDGGWTTIGIEAAPGISSRSIQLLGQVIGCEVGGGNRGGDSDRFTDERQSVHDRIGEFNVLRADRDPGSGRVAQKRRVLLQQSDLVAASLLDQEDRAAQEENQHRQQTADQAYVCLRGANREGVRCQNVLLYFVDLRLVEAG